MKSIKELRGLPKSIKIKRVAENDETVAFKQYFESWEPSIEPQNDSIEPQNDEVFNKNQEVNPNVQNDDPLPLPHKAADQQVKFLSNNLSMTSKKETTVEPQNEELFNKDQKVNANVQNDDPLPPHRAADQKVKFLSFNWISDRKSFNF